MFDQYHMTEIIELINIKVLTMEMETLLLCGWIETLTETGIHNQ